MTVRKSWVDVRGTWHVGVRKGEGVSEYRTKKWVYGKSSEISFYDSHNVKVLETEAGGLLIRHSDRSPVD